MTSEVSLKSEEREWLTRKARIGDKLGEIVESIRKTLIEMEPDLRAIRDKKLWRFGNYESFEQFCNKALGVTRQRVYQILKDDKSLKSLEIKEVMSNNLTPTPENEATTEPEKSESVSLFDPSPEPEKVAPATKPTTREKRAKATTIDAATGKPEVKTDTEIEGRLKLKAYDWLRLINLLNSPDAIDLRAAVHGCAERAGVVIP